MSPAEVGMCSLWQFNAAVAGWITANTTETPGEMTQADEDDIWEGVMERM
ncbi:hypothetical protein [Pontibaca methylaminivorans]|uniref:Uncharacterized protein n=1 Tax=Pontibaca methylaminivorans TaxID=515897 RepID=A0A1R3WEB7_9RHOB|nr:hypothetical protein [Pontibaca methylaminivorans]SIT74763.1 hypothetical protein SAMN05421849_0210 [Pontibaca methylaminivorans]